MITNYFKIAFRNLSKHKVYSFINIGGLAAGMAVAMLIGLWIWDELSFDKYHENYDRIAQVNLRGENDGKAIVGSYLPIPLGAELKNKFSGDFRYVVMATGISDHIVACGDNKFTQKGAYLGPEAPEMLTLKMLHGTRSGLTEPSSVLLSGSVSRSLFGDDDPVGKIVKIDNKLDVKVTGVYEDLPRNTQFHELTFIAPWDLYVSSEEWVKKAQDEAVWSNNSWHTLVQLAPNADLGKINAKIKNIITDHFSRAKLFKLEVFLHPMRLWHLYTAWDNDGQVSKGRIQYVWLFGIIGFFVLLLACINFMNLSTARSEKRAREVGIRKAIGSFRTQLMVQFFSESLMIVAFAFVMAMFLVWLILPWFNSVADKKMAILWQNPAFWALGLGFSIVTALIAGSYPALYLSSFKPVKVLKGAFRAGRFAATPRKILVVVQFTASIALIVGTIIVYQQIRFAKNRPIGYSRDGLISITLNTPDLLGHYDALRNDLLETGAVAEMCTSSSPTTDVNSSNVLGWEGKDPNFNANFGTIAVTHDYGKTVGWQFREGRDFSRQFSTDTAAVVINETAAKYIGVKDPVGLTMTWGDKKYTVIGVIRDMVMGSPFKPVQQTVFLLDYGWANVIQLRINPSMSAGEALPRIAAVFGVHNPGAPFDYRFVDAEYAQKFAGEERIGKLASFFAILAIFISCLGLFGLASFIAERRTKEIGVRKVLGASTYNVWRLLSKEFMTLVLISCLISAPIAYYYLQAWLRQYEYRTEISWWIFAFTGLGALAITILTVSFQSLKAALANPVKSLRSE